MPTAGDFQTEAAATALTASYVVLVNERIDRLAPAVAAGTRQQLAAATYTLHFTVNTVATVRTLVAVDIYTGAQPGSLPLYFLPWCQNAATEMTIPPGGAGPGIFMTSMLSGCSVQVHGTAANPTITHANARSTYDDAYTRLADWLKSGDHTPQQVHDFAETRANTIATGAINAMLPATGGAHVGVVRKSDYAGKVTNGNLIRAQRSFLATLPASQTISSYEVAKMALKPKTGAFVFGVRDLAHNWVFYYQAAVEVEIEVDEKFMTAPKQHFTYDSAVLGQPTRIFP